VTTSEQGPRPLPGDQGPDQPSVSPNPTSPPPDLGVVLAGVASATEGLAQDVRVRMLQTAEWVMRGGRMPVAREGLDVRGVLEWDAALEAEADPGWIARPVWPGDAYGVLAAESKAGKTWAALDLAVSVATGTAWMGRFPCEQGQVLYFAGEGGSRATMRRLKAICQFMFPDDPDPLARLGERLRLCFRPPNLTDDKALAAVRGEVTAHPPRLVIIDPLYLAAPKAQGSDLYGMGEVLGKAQQIAQEAKAAMVIVHHWSKTGRGEGFSRMSGAGPAEWGRVLCSGRVNARRLDPAGATEVTVQWSFVGGEIPDLEYATTRKVWADDRDSLTSPLHYELREAPLQTPASGFKGTKGEVFRVLEDLDPGATLTVPEVLERVNARRGRRGEGPRQKRTIQNALSGLAGEGAAIASGTKDGGFQWRLRTPEEQEAEDG